MSWEEMQTIENNDGRREKEKLPCNISWRQAGMSKIVWTIKVMLGWSHHRYFFIIHINPFSLSKDKKIYVFFFYSNCRLLQFNLPEIGINHSTEAAANSEKKSRRLFYFYLFYLLLSACGLMT